MMKRTSLIFALLLALLMVMLPLQAMAAVGEGVTPEDGDISITIPGGSTTPAVYTVVFKDWDGTVLSTQKYNYGDEVVAPEAPTKEADETYTYAFVGWNKAVTACVGNATYTAVYEEVYIDYTVTFKAEDGSVIASETYHYGDEVVAPEAPAKEADETYTYVFAGWDKEVVACAGNAEYTATYTSAYIDYTVQFVNDDGTVISSATYHYGDAVVAPEAPTKEADEKYTYEFAGWDKEVVACAGNATYTATYTATEIETPDVPVDPIIKHPEDQLVAYNATAQFTVEATGVVSYQWQYRRNADSKWQTTKLTGYNTPTLSVVMTSGRNGYQYRCALTMEDGSVIYSEPATLTMDAKVEITGAPADCTALEGSFAPFTVEATDVRSYRWYYRHNEADSWHPTAMKGYVTPTLQVLVLPNREGYQYRCKMIGNDGTINYTEPATLHVAKVILTQPTNIAGVIGETAEFHIDVQNVKEIQWLYRQTPEKPWGDTRMEGNTTDTLKVPVTAARKGYQYRAKLTNNDGSILYSNEVTLYLAPIVTTHPEDVTVVAGQVATFTVVADETVTYQWQFRREGINWTNTSAAGNTTETLNVTTKISNNGYQYRCKLTGAEGSVQYTDAATLTVTAE